MDENYPLLQRKYNNSYSSSTVKYDIEKGHSKRGVADDLVVVVITKHLGGEVFTTKAVETFECSQQNGNESQKEKRWVGHIEPHYQRTWN